MPEIRAFNISVSGEMIVSVREMEWWMKAYAEIQPFSHETNPQRFGFGRMGIRVPVILIPRRDSFHS